MNTQQTPATQLQACNYDRPQIAEAILVILLGLTAKTALDQVFSQVPNVEGFKSIFSQFTINSGRHALIIGQLVIFFFTTFRFYLGTLRYHQIRGHYAKLRALIWDVIGTLIIFTGFYLSALALRSPDKFYFFMGGLHFLDLLWFGGAWLIAYMPESQQEIIKKFIIYDLITFGSFALLGIGWWALNWTFGPPYIYQVLCLVVLLVVGIFDCKQQSSLYRGGRNA